MTIKRINCVGIAGETTLMLEIANEYREPGNKLATTGYKKARARDLMFQEINRAGGTSLIVLDEIDTLDELDTFLYQVPRVHETGKVDPDVDVGIIGISNDPQFIDELDEDRKKTLAEELISFSEYDSTELRDVLFQRAPIAFRHTEVVENEHGKRELDSEVVETGVIPLTAAHATRSTGDARMAITLLRMAGDLARDRGAPKATEGHVDEALERYQREKIAESVEKLESTAKVVLYALVTLIEEMEPKAGDTPPRSRAVAARYHDLHSRTGNDPVSGRQVRNHLNKMETIGIADGTKQSGGGDGTYTQWTLNYESDVILPSIHEVVEYVGVDSSVQDLVDVGAD